MTLLSLENFIRKEVRKMVEGIGSRGTGNIYPLIMEEVERHIVKTVLEETQYNYFTTAKILGISRSKLYRRIKHLLLNKL